MKKKQFACLAKILITFPYTYVTVDGSSIIYSSINYNQMV